MNGFSISSNPPWGHTNITAVPRHTTNPRSLVFSVNLYGSFGSININICTDMYLYICKLIYSDIILYTSDKFFCFIQN